jgi:hypothetical protein
MFEKFFKVLDENKLEQPNVCDAGGTLWYCLSEYMQEEIVNQLCLCFQEMLP